MIDRERDREREKKTITWAHLPKILSIGLLESLALLIRSLHKLLPISAKKKKMKKKPLFNIYCKMNNEQWTLTQRDKLIITYNLTLKQFFI